MINQTIGKKNRLSCVSRPRRFGKSYAANMLEAYYDCSCDSHALFDDLEIAKDPDYEKHMNQYNVLYLDITGFMADATLAELPRYILNRILLDIRNEYPDIGMEVSVKEALSTMVSRSSRKFIAIIDEWDAPVRDPQSTPKTQKEFLEFLRSLFKSDITKNVFAAAYMTGILPIKKDGTQSAISEFREYSILRPEGFAPFVGFLEKDVRGICDANHISFEDMKAWYDGYIVETPDKERLSVYNPNSVIRASENGRFESYWVQSSAVYGALDYINLDFDGLGEAAELLTAGLEVSFQTQTFKNDLTSFESADDVLTILTHFGYLTYDNDKQAARIPNHEIMTEFAGMIHRVTHKETMIRLKESEQLLADIIAGRADAVAANIQKVHMKESTPLWYNDEQALRAVVKLAFFTYRDHYIKLEELPSGTGYVDMEAILSDRNSSAQSRTGSPAFQAGAVMAYYPKKYDPSPALIIELKAGGTPEEAMEQIRSRNYASSLEGLGESILLVAVTYDKEDKTKPHHCLICKA